ncbi:thyrostimulin alpha-2 subunit-like [Parasteatoda tepidariorum]|uniref:thyrostimulin alpha-2 subunit-like n=1 Tax=Parasteatoda tepidariorum TaxID=114398 RepID=UPI00077FC8F9|nr:thyrostimulin alpha-2 subunit-like [Parasteatoda tepidariorum]
MMVLSSSQFLCHKLLFILILLLADDSLANHWERPGCFKVGHSRTISIPGCIEFDVATNACRGFCVSYSVPSSEDHLLFKPYQAITSYGQCCSIMETEDVKVKVMCIDGPKALTFKSAVTCDCDHCKKPFKEVVNMV